MGHQYKLSSFNVFNGIMLKVCWKNDVNFEKSISLRNSQGKWVNLVRLRIEGKSCQTIGNVDMGNIMTLFSVKLVMIKKQDKNGSGNILHNVNVGEINYKLANYAKKIGVKCRISMYGQLCVIGKLENPAVQVIK